jgi:hypothetical protein
MKIFKYNPFEIQDQFLIIPSIRWHTYCQINGRQMSGTHFSKKEIDAAVIVRTYMSTDLLGTANTVNVNTSRHHSKVRM